MTDEELWAILAKDGPATIEEAEALRAAWNEKPALAMEMFRSEELMLWLRRNKDLIKQWNETVWTPRERARRSHD